MLYACFLSQTQTHIYMYKWTDSQSDVILFETAYGKIFKTKSFRNFIVFVFGFIVRDCVK